MKVPVLEKHEFEQLRTLIKETSSADAMPSTAAAMLLDSTGTPAR